jgi:hypothetical protein
MIRRRTLRVTVTHPEPATGHHLRTFVSCTQMNELRPALGGWLLLPKLLHGAVERVCDGVCVDGLVRHEFLIEPFRHSWAVFVAHDPALTRQLRQSPCFSTPTDHIVATTDLKPANSIAAARCMTWSGCLASPLAVSQAERYANHGWSSLRSMSLEIVSMLSCR